MDSSGEAGGEDTLPESEIPSISADTVGSGTSGTALQKTEAGKGTQLSH